MIASISAWLKSVIAVTVLGSFVEMVLPEGKMQKYVAFAVGLMVLTAIAGPVISVEGIELLPRAAVEQRDYRVDAGQIAAAVQERIKSELSVEYVRVELDESLQVAAVYVADENHLQRVADFLELPVEKVRLEGDTNGKPAN